ncbi:MAG: adenylate cyclase regulatory domain-containing protein [Acidimicrobiales bacterium]|jgi:adenylate cyclase
MPDDLSNPVEPLIEHARVDALARVRLLLRELGSTDGEIDRAVEDDVLDLLVVDRILVPSGHRLTGDDVTLRTGIPIEVTRRFWRALGFLDVDEAEPAFTEMDIEAVQIFQAMVAMGLVDLETAVQMARVIGSSMARIAEAEAAPGNTPILVGTGDSILDADQFAQQAEVSIPAMGRLLEYVWRRHLQAATHRAMLHRSRGAEEGVRPVMAIGFADMVGFTMLSQHLGDEELAAVVVRFEELAHDTVVALGGRVVKMIGDEVMFVVPTALDAAQIGLSLAEAYSDDDLLSDVRVALASGPVLMKDGDFYGPVVNLASRLVGVAHPGTVLISDEFRDALAAEGATDIETRPLRARNLKDIGRVQVWKLLRAGTEPGADSRRTMRWERLGEVLRELDELRERGEQVRPRGAGASGAKPGGGDAVGPKGEGSLERGDRAPT